MTQDVNPPEYHRKIDIFVNMLLRHRNKANIEQNNKCGINVE